MKIEKISRYIDQTAPSRSSSTQTPRKVLLSLPRVRFLEDKEESKVDSIEGNYIELTKMKSYMTLTGREKEMLRLLDYENLSPADVAKQRNISVKTVMKAASEARKKIALRSGEK